MLLSRAAFGPAKNSLTFRNLGNFIGENKYLGNCKINWQLSRVLRIYILKHVGWDSEFVSIFGAKTNNQRVNYNNGTMVRGPWLEALIQSLEKSAGL